MLSASVHLGPISIFGSVLKNFHGTLKWKKDQLAIGSLRLDKASRGIIRCIAVHSLFF